MSDAISRELLVVRDKILKWNENYRVTVNGSKIEVHNWLADFNSKWTGIDGETMSMNTKVNAHTLDMEINNIIAVMNKNTIISSNASKDTLIIWYSPPTFVKSVVQSNGGGGGGGGGGTY